MIMIDNFDWKILDYLQRKGDATNAELGEYIHISASQAGRRKARLEAENIIEGYRARIKAEAVNLNIQAFIQVSLETHSKDNAFALKEFLLEKTNIVNIWTMTGRADYLLQVYCEDLAELNSLIHNALLSHKNISHVESQIVMNQIKSNAVLPLKR